MSNVNISVRRILVTAFAAILLSASAGGTSVAQEASELAAVPTVVLAGASTPLTAVGHLEPSLPWKCPLGKARKKGKGCRGGSIVKGVKKGVTKCLEGGKTGAGVGGMIGGTAAVVTAQPEAVPLGAAFGGAIGCGYASTRK